MEIYEETFKLSSELNNLLWSVEEVLGDNSLVRSDKYNSFVLRNGLTFEQIKDRLNKSGVVFTEHNLYKVLCMLLSNYQRIARREYWNKDTEYELLDMHFWEHGVQEKDVSFKDDFKCNKVFLLMSDTHIGCKKIYNSKIINNLYDYAIKNGSKKCFHLGDLFHGCSNLSEKRIGSITKGDIDNFENEFCRQLNLFIKEYPNPKPSEFMTYGLVGNHDESMNMFLKYCGFSRKSDLRKLSLYNSSFSMFLRDSFSAELNDIKFHFNHRLFMSIFFDDIKINKLSDIEEMKINSFGGGLMLDTLYNVLVSGHLHKGIINTEADFFDKEINKLYLGVPAAGNINIGGAVGYLVYLYPDSNSMEVSILGCNNNLEIYEIDRIPWYFGKRNKTYKRTL